MNTIIYLFFLCAVSYNNLTLAHEPDCNHESLEEARARESEKHDKHH